MRIAFLGTPKAAVPTLLALPQMGDVVMVITQPDRPRGRSGTPSPTPVKAAALEAGLPVHQPETSRDIAPLLQQALPDVAVLVAFGMLIRPDALALPTAGIVNVHFSLLPRWRGAAPVQRAILAGDARTGVTLMQLDPGLDTGPILATRSTAIGPEEPAGSLTARLADLGARLVSDSLATIVGGAVVALPQAGVSVTHAPKIDRGERVLDVSMESQHILRHLRAMDPAPGSWTIHESGRLRIREARATGDFTGLEPGELRLEGKALFMGTGGGGTVELLTVQPEGKGPMSAADWARGRPGELGTLS